MSLSSGDEVPHIFTRKSRLRPGKFLTTGAKRVLQQNLPGPDSCTATRRALFEHLVGAGVKHRRHGDPERFCCFEVDDHFEGRRLHHR
jgi:hypothetical protein